MKIRIANGQEWHLHFDYRPQYNWGPPRMSGPVRTFRGYDTVLTAHQGECAKSWPCAKGTIHGKALLHPNDQFIKWVGRKIALTRALAQMPRADRTEIWKAYLKISPPPPSRIGTKTKSKTEVKVESQVGNVPGGGGTNAA